ncbi:hypothetical protein [Actinomycetospora flava]|uniref:ApeA N-terminal domain-containing protein n=1 Tax=Actinomycetospora flava TaxID=3129232 RepID=A0ABU8MB31_9PSEU
MKITLRTDMWPHWLLVAISNAELANEGAHAAREEQTSDHEPDGGLDGLTRELHHSLQAVTACAFATDSLYAAVKARAPALTVEATWRKKRTKRTAQISETLRQHLGIKPKRAGEVRQHLDTLFRYRDWAVHPGSRFVEPYTRSDLQVALDWHYSAFSAVSAVNVTIATVGLFRALVPLAETAKHPELREWHAGAADHVERVRQTMRSNCWGDYAAGSD